MGAKWSRPGVVLVLVACRGSQEASLNTWGKRYVPTLTWHWPPKDRRPVPAPSSAGGDGRC